MKKKNKTNNQVMSANFSGVEHRLEVVLILLSEILSQLAKKTGDLKAVARSKEKAAIILVNDGMAKGKVAKLLTIQKKRVVDAFKK